MQCESLNPKHHHRSLLRQRSLARAFIRFAVHTFYFFCFFFRWVFEFVIFDLGVLVQIRIDLEKKMNDFKMKMGLLSITIVKKKKQRVNGV